MSERLLGVLVNNTATFKNHIIGDADNPGLMKQLATRVRMLKNKITRRCRRKGIGLLVDHGGKEQTSLIWHTASRSV